MLRKRRVIMEKNIGRHRSKLWRCLLKRRPRNVLNSSEAGRHTDLYSDCVRSVFHFALK